MNVFALGTGRCGTTTFIRAVEHCTNYTAGHETRFGRATDRFDLPDRHIEADNRLSWMLGALAERYGSDAFYVHLVRDPDDTARSFVRRWAADPAPRDRDGAPSWVRRRRRVIERHPRYRLMEAFAYGILGQARAWPEEARPEIARFMVDTITANIRDFLRDRPHTVVQLEDPTEGLTRTWRALGAEGDLDAALAEYQVRHNASRQA